MAEINQERHFKCDDCEKLFTRKTTQRDHHARMHKNDLRYSCFVCKKGFYDKGGMRKHLTVHDEAVQNRSQKFQIIRMNFNNIITLISEKDQVKICPEISGRPAWLWWDGHL